MTVVQHCALPPGVFDADIDKRHRVPDQVGVRGKDLLVERRGLGGTHQLDRNAELRMPATIDVAAQIVEPPVLITGIGTNYLRCRGTDQRGGRGGGRTAKRAVAPGRPVVSRNVEVGAAVYVGAEPVATHNMEGKVILRPTEPARFDVHADMATITDKLLREEVPV